MKIFISGNPRSGKTSLIKKIIYDFGKENFFGFYTEEIAENRERIGFKIVTTFEKEYLLSRKDIKTNYRFGKYFILKENLDEISKIILENLDSNKEKIIVVDEIGPMEFYSEFFVKLTERIIREDFNVLGVVHRKFLHLIPNYIWLERNRWWEIYEFIKNKIKNILWRR
ncbi:MAG: nucleoside-triphosphatase [Nanopusillaceae archaeon]